MVLLFARNISPPQTDLVVFQNITEIVMVTKYAWFVPLPCHTVSRILDLHKGMSNICDPIFSPSAHLTTHRTQEKYINSKYTVTNKDVHPISESLTVQ